MLATPEMNNRGAAALQNNPAVAAVNSAVPATSRPAAWQQVVVAAGFHPLPGTAGGYRHGGFTFTCQDGWGILSVRPRRRPREVLADQPGTPGPWRWLQAPASGRLVRVFELPPWIVQDAAAGDLFREALDWAVATGEGDTPAGWTCPPAEEVQGWIPREGLTVRSGPLIRQGELLHETNRLGLRFPLLTAIPGNLSQARHQWLEALMMRAQSCWRLARFGAEAGCLHAEINLSGAPPQALPRLFRLGVTAVRLVVKWTLEPADFLVRGNDAAALQSPVRASARHEGEDMSNGNNTATAVLDPVDENSFRLQATDVTGTQSVEAFGVARSTPAGAVASALASQMQLPDDVPWVLRDDATSAYLEETLPIGDQIEPDSTVTITPKTHLG